MATRRSPCASWVPRNFFPPYEIWFRGIHSFIRQWFDELLIAACYYQPHVLQQFSHHMNNWAYVGEPEKIAETLRILNSTGSWEAVEAFNLMMEYHPYLYLRLTPPQQCHRMKAFDDGRQLPFGFSDPWERMLQILTHDVEKRALGFNNYQYVLYAIYVFRVDRVHYQYRVADKDILNYFEDIHRHEISKEEDIIAMDNMSDYGFESYQSTRTAKIKFYRYVREFVIGHFEYTPYALIEGWGELWNFAYDRVLRAPQPRYQIDKGELLPTHRGAPLTALQTLLEQICELLKPHCTTSLLYFKVHLHQMHSLARIVLYIGKSREYRRF